MASARESFIIRRKRADHSEKCSRDGIARKESEEE